jgi:hypothetical protein
MVRAEREGANSVLRPVVACMKRGAMRTGRVGRQHAPIAPRLIPRRTVSIGPMRMST